MIMLRYLLASSVASTFAISCFDTEGVLSLGTSVHHGPLDATEFRLVCWNVHKGFHLDAVHDLDTLALEADLLLLQEAKPHMARPEYDVHFAASWCLPLQSPNGVMTLSRCRTRHVEAVRAPDREFFIATPKAALVSDHAVGDVVMRVINLHGLNFEPCARLLGRQLDDLAARLVGFHGPLIVAGDFNTWNRDRYVLMMEMAQRFGLRRAQAREGRGLTASFGALERWLPVDRHLELDHVFTRGLDVLDCSWRHDIVSSDHTPLVLTLRLAQDEWVPEPPNAVTLR